MRAYIGTGSDEEKLALLQKYAPVNYLIARIFPVPVHYSLQPGQPVYHTEAYTLMKCPIVLFEEAIKAVQRDLPVQTPSDIPARPLVCLTPLLGDDDRNIRPKIDEIKRIS